MMGGLQGVQMANAEYSDNPDRKYLVKGRHGIPAKTLFPKASVAKGKDKFPGIPVKKGFKFMKKGT